ncbi:MAG TPA: LamG-like jellyroll fold domain-containing protein [Candidatus Binatia bacterium]|nr:LamG-like jellyroll fold domain-containing protein [Candidatus Binatia bacterium]
MTNSTWLSATALVLAIASSPAMAQTPILELAFDEGSGTTAVNSGSLGASADGVISSATYSASTPFGTGFALSFDGDTDFVDIADAYDYGSTLTLEAWIKPDAVDGQRVIYDDYGSPGVLVAISSGVLQFNLSTAAHPGLGTGIFAGSICPGLWQHIAGTYDGAIMRAYVNGIEVGTVETSGDIIDNGAFAARIGAESEIPSVLEFAGRMDDFRVFLDALAPEALAGGSSLLLCGELTGDCAITASDALAALLMAVGLGAPDPAADVNNSATVTASDALQILRIAVGTDEHTNVCNA